MSTWNPASPRQTPGRAVFPIPIPPDFDPDVPLVPKRVLRGGSYLCYDSYCSSYRALARMKASPDTSLSHSGLRRVKE
jgi:formylglycine-generating enzyme required for sulfatase activity